MYFHSKNCKLVVRAYKGGGVVVLFKGECSVGVGSLIIRILKIKVKLEVLNVIQGPLMHWKREKLWNLTKMRNNCDPSSIMIHGHRIEGDDCKDRHCQGDQGHH